MIMKRETALYEQRERGGTTAAKMNFEEAERRVQQWMEKFGEILNKEIHRLVEDGFSQKEIAEQSALDQNCVSKISTGVLQWYASMDTMLLAGGCLGVDHPALDPDATVTIEELVHGDRSNIHMMTIDRRRSIIENRIERLRETLVVSIRDHVKEDGRTPLQMNQDLELPSDLLPRVCRQRIPPKGVIVKTERLLALCYLLKRPLANVRIKVV